MPIKQAKSCRSWRPFRPDGGGRPVSGNHRNRRRGSIRNTLLLVMVLGVLIAAAVLVTGPSAARGDRPEDPPEIAKGRQIFRYDTFGNEQLWTDELRLHEVVENVDPLTALAVGLKVDADRLPPNFFADNALDDPATTVELLRRDAVIGLQAKINEDDETGQPSIKTLGITCALCHSEVDDSVVDGVGSRLDGWPNSDLNVGAIIALSPAVPEAEKEILLGWGPGRFDPYFNQDGVSEPVVIPPAYGLQGVALETFIGVGPISYWNNYVAVTQMGGQGSFVEPKLNLFIQARPDRVTPKLDALREYQLTLSAPPPPAGFFDPEAAARGEELFMGKAGCAVCHIPPTFTDAPLLWDPSAIPTDPTFATRPASITGKWRTTPLRALWQHPPYFHDGSAETLGDVIDVYDEFFELELNDDEKADLEEFLRSL